MNKPDLFSRTNLISNLTESSEEANYNLTGPTTRNLMSAMMTNTRSSALSILKNTNSDREINTNNGSNITHESPLGFYSANSVTFPVDEADTIMFHDSPSQYSEVSFVENTSIRTVESKTESPAEISPENLKKSARRERNRVAAAKCRQRKLNRIDALQEEVDSVNRQLLEAKDKNQRYKQYIQQLEFSIQSHIAKCCLAPDDDFLKYKGNWQFHNACDLQKFQTNVSKPTSSSLTERRGRNSSEGPKLTNISIPDITEIESSIPTIYCKSANIYTPNPVPIKTPSSVESLPIKDIEESLLCSENIFGQISSSPSPSKGNANQAFKF
jgi:hypothetical protein